MPKSKAGNIFLENEMDFARFLPALGNWFHEQRIELAHTPPLVCENPTLLMGVAVWGRKFIDNFLHYCIPTLLAPLNVAALTNRLLLVIHTDAESFDYLKERVRYLEDYRIDLEIHIIPQHLLDMVPERETNKYWLLGTIQHYYLLEAAHKGMNFHMLMPDHVYSNEFFPNLLRLAAQGHEGIIQSSINGTLEKCTEILENHRFANFITVDAQQLMDIGFANLHTGISACIMNGRDPLDNITMSNYLIWVGKNTVYTFSPHASLLYLSNRLLRKITLRLHNALDTQIPYYIPTHETFYKPTRDDGVVYIELTEASKPFATQTGNFYEFCFRYWVLTHFNRDFERIYAVPNEFPVSEQKDGLPDEHILANMAGISSALSRTYDAMYREHEALEAA